MSNFSFKHFTFFCSFFFLFRLLISYLSKICLLYFFLVFIVYFWIILSFILFVTTYIITLTVSLNYRKQKKSLIRPITMNQKQLPKRKTPKKMKTMITRLWVFFLLLFIKTNKFVVYFSCYLYYFRFSYCYFCLSIIITFKNHWKFHVFKILITFYLFSSTKLIQSTPQKKEETKTEEQETKVENKKENEGYILYSIVICQWPHWV